MQRHDAGLHAEPHEREQEDDGHRGRERNPLDFERTGSRSEEREGGEETGRAGVRRDEIHPCGAPDLRLNVVRGDEKKGGDGHQLPREQEEHRMRRRDDEREADGHERIEEPQARGGSRLLLAGPVPEPIDGAEARHEEDHEKKNRRESVETKEDRTSGHVPRRDEERGPRREECAGGPGESRERADHREGRGRALGEPSSPDQEKDAAREVEDERGENRVNGGHVPPSAPPRAASRRRPFDDSRDLDHAGGRRTAPDRLAERPDREGGTRSSPASAGGRGSSG